MGARLADYLLKHFYVDSPDKNLLSLTFRESFLLVLLQGKRKSELDISACFSRPSNEERKVWAEILQLKEKQKDISMKDEFAAFSKLQRKINVLENKLKDNSQNRYSKSIAFKGSVHIILQVVVGLLILCSVIWFRREPIVVLKGNLFPFSTILRYPSEMPNSISTHIWVLVSNISIRTLIKPIV